MKKTFQILNSTEVPKGWGNELHIVNNLNYCLKLLVFEAGKKFSMHYHLDKTETWYVSEGEFILRLINTDNSEIVIRPFKKGNIITLHPGQPHQLEAIVDSTIIEVSTFDQPHDNYRVFPGDSQK